MSKIDTSRRKDVLDPAQLVKQLTSMLGVGGVKKKPRRRCERCGKFGLIDRHHVVYEPEVVADLCRKCHKEVTRLNTLVAREAGRALMNVDRVKVWVRFMKGSQGDHLQRCLSASLTTVARGALRTTQF